MSNLSYTQRFQGVADVFLRDPDLYAPLLRFIDKVMTRESELSKADRELIAAHVSTLNGCDFCVGAHEATLIEMGVDRAAIARAKGGPEAVAANDRLRSLLRFARKLTVAPRDIEGADIELLRVDGWSDQAIEDTINVVSLFAYVNRLVDAIGIHGNEAYFRRVGKALATQGYAPLLAGMSGARRSSGPRTRAG